MCIDKTRAREKPQWLVHEIFLTANCRSSPVRPDSSVVLSCANLFLRSLASISVSPNVTDSSMASWMKIEEKQHQDTLKM